MIISSLDNSKIKEINKLKNKKNREESKKFIVEGEHLIKEAFKSGYLIELIKTENIDFNIEIPTTIVTEDVMKKISYLESPNGLLGVCRFIEENKEIGNKLLILDNIQDPGNLGTIIRSCVAFNISTLIVSENTVDIYNDKVIRSSQGMIFNMNIIRAYLNEFIPYLKDFGYKIYTTDVNGGESLKNIKISDKCAIIMGNEANGVSDSINELSDKRIYIKMNDLCESLNVGVAASIILYEFDK